MTLLSQIDTTARKQIVQQIQKWNTSAFIEMPSTWAGNNRYFPQGTSNYPGQLNHDIAPHMIEIQDNFHPDSGIVLTSVMKSTQSLATSTIENVIGWAIRHKLHNILYIISSKGMAKMRSSAAIDVLIDYSGLQDCIKPISTRMKRKTADNTFYKELSGGYRLMMTSYNSIADAKSFSWDLIVFDEIDEAPYELKGQGDPEKLFEVRGITARHLKMAKISTPTNTHGRINRNFLEGDQRYFYCQCPNCGEFQILQMMTEGREHGLTFRTERLDKIDIVIKDSVNYVCKDCKDLIYEYQKQDLLTNGKWVPTARPINPAYRSYHISNLMSPIMFYTWDRICQDFVETGFGQNITKLKAFIINILGEPWEARADKKSWQELQEKADDYIKGTIPAGGLMLLGGADVQKNRIELQVVAYGENMQSWMVDYQYFYGPTNNKENRVWKDFEEFIRTTKYPLKNTEISITRTAVDSGYNPNLKKTENSTDFDMEHIVYSIVARNHTRMISCRGKPKLKDMLIKEERVKRRSSLKTRYDTAVNELKDEFFVKLDYQKGAQGEIHFPKDAGEEYFKGIVSEVYAEVKPGKWEYTKIFDRNEPLDTYILTRAAAEFVNIPVWKSDHWARYEKKILRMG